MWFVLINAAVKTLLQLLSLPANLLLTFWQVNRPRWSFLRMVLVLGLPEEDVVPLMPLVSCQCGCQCSNYTDVTSHEHEWCQWHMWPSMLSPPTRHAGWLTDCWRYCCLSYNWHHTARRHLMLLTFATVTGTLTLLAPCLLVYVWSTLMYNVYSSFLMCAGARRPHSALSPSLHMVLLNTYMYSCGGFHNLWVTGEREHEEEPCG